MTLLSRLVGIDWDEDEAANTGHSRAESNQTRDLL